MNRVLSTSLWKRCISAPGWRQQSTASKFILTRHFDGVPKLSDMQLVHQELPPLKDGEILCKATYLSVDPYMRPYSTTWPVPCTMQGGQVAQVVESRHAEYPVGTNLVGYFGWRTHTIVQPDRRKDDLMGQVVRLPELGGLPASLGLGAVGMPGASAYFGLLDICQPVAGETVVVSGAAGAVGSLVGQIAKIKGCRVIGFAGSDDKVRWLVDDLGFDAAYNYKARDVKGCLKESAGDGIDCYFDNVGGSLSATVRSFMRPRGRISVCGAVALYNDTRPTLAPCIEPVLVFKQIRMEGFLVHRWIGRYPEAMHQMLQWIQQGKIQVRETYTDGFENMPQAFIDMLAGGNTGKAIVRV